MRHQRKMARHQQKLASFQLLLTNKARQSSFEVIRKSNQAIVYAFSHNDRSFRSSAPVSFYKGADSRVFYLSERPKINSIDPQGDIDLIISKPPSSWRFPLACALLFASISFLAAFFSPVFRERLEYWMYKRRASST